VRCGFRRRIAIILKSTCICENFASLAYLAVLVAGWFRNFAGHTCIVWEGPDLIQEQKDFTAREAGLALGLTVV